MESMDVDSRRCVWVESMGVVVRMYIDFLTLFITTPLVFSRFCTISTLCSFKKIVSFLLLYFL